MGIYLLLIQLLCICQIANPAFSQRLNVVKVGGSNFGNVNLVSYMNYTFMGTTGFPYSNENYIYNINGNFGNYGKLISFESNITTSNLTNFQNFSTQSFLYEPFWMKVSGNNLVEVYNIYNNESLELTIEQYFDFKEIVEFAPVVVVYDVIFNNISYVFPFIIKENGTSFLIFSVSDADSLIYNYYLKETFKIKEVRGKGLSCFSLLFPSRIICLFVNEKYQLIAEAYNDFYNETTLLLNQLTNSYENENLFFKGISYTENSLVLAYYQDNYLTITVKYYNTTHFVNYNENDTLEIDATNFNKSYKLNDIVKIDSGDIYFAASSNDRETLYIIIFKINEYNITKRLITIDLFADYNLKFYKDLKLINSGDSTIMGFSHCYQKRCEDISYHSTSLITFNDFKSEYDFDVIQSLYDSNINQNESIIIDLDIYKDNILGLKYKYIEFLNIPEGITIRFPSNNSQVSTGVTYTLSKFKLEMPLNVTGDFFLRYSMNMDDSDTGPSSNLRRLMSMDKIIDFKIILREKVTSSCEDKCSLCILNSAGDCISCKYQYKFVGNKKFCLDKNNEMDNNTTEIYEALSENILEQKFDVIESDNALLQLSPIDLQLKNDVQNLSSIDLGDCEKKLREQEGLDDEEQFLMIKMDAKNNEISATYVQYEIYNPITGKQVNLAVCEDIPITLYTPVILSEDKLTIITDIEDAGYNAFDIRDNFYNDVCSPYTAPNGADMILSLRKSQIYDKNKDIYFCQSGCEFANYNTKNGKSECNCKVQQTKTITNLASLQFDKTEFLDSFYKTLYNSNFRVLKCVNLLFSSKGLSSNYGGYIMLLLLGLFIAFMILHIINGQKNIIEIINSVLIYKGIDIEKDNLEKVNEKNDKIEQRKQKDKKKEKEEKKEKREKEEKKEKEENGKKDEKEKKEEKEEKKKEDEIKENDKGPERRKSIKKKSKRHKKEDKDKKIEDLQAPSKRRNSKHKSKNTEKIESQPDNINEAVIDTKMDLENNDKIEVKQKDKKERRKSKHHHNKETQNDDEIYIQELSKGLNDQEINTLEYEDALVIDKRTYFQYYLSLLKKKHLLLFTFYPTDDYNLMPMKILLFIVSFSLYFTINGFFFSDDTMNKIYENDNAYNFFNQLPQIFYSSVISAVINMILKMLSLSEKKVLEIKKEKDIVKAKEKAKSAKKELKITLIIFLAISSLFMLFFCYFISCFCAVYQNTQATLIEDTLISFGLSMLYPFALNLLPGFFRIPALRAEKKNKKYLYKISGYVALI